MTLDSNFFEAGYAMQTKGKINLLTFISLNGILSKILKKAMIRRVNDICCLQRTCGW